MSVWIAEDIEHHWVLTGRFSGHLERGDELVEAFSDLDAEQAIAWGRARADVVLIRLGDGDYRSAGRRNPNPERFPTWPPAGPRPKRRRARGYEALDNTEDDPPTLWDVLIEVGELPGQADPWAYRRSVEAEQGLIDVQTPAPGHGELSAAFTVSTSTRQQADAIAHDVAGRAFRAVMKANADRIPDGGFQYSWAVEPHRVARPA